MLVSIKASLRGTMNNSFDLWCVVAVLLLLLSTAEASKADCQAGPHNVNVNTDVPPSPEQFVVHWKTSVAATADSPATISIQVNRKWSPKGADRFYQLIQDNYYNCNGFFRVVPNFVVQFGLAQRDMIVVPNSL